MHNGNLGPSFGYAWTCGGIKTFLKACIFSLPFKKTAHHCKNEWMTP